ncbi:ankyrin repeats (3 copies) domain-containing protein [Ditylenchus destructor]|uniref:Ankyrin repeats (3 copies) domain-containing protein n=1 Tax=Ditylenchus destructor TaxID=166010 RepID=A0AAD4QWH0_9BILA|nr:ankyrin repeats (3 copies) domain-containing protein [Ditylenchus destructor]
MGTMPGSGTTVYSTPKPTSDSDSAWSKTYIGEPDEVQFAQDLLNVGDGSANDESGKVDLAKMKLEKSSITKEKLSKEIFQNLIKSKKWEEVSKCAILSPYNVETEMHNAEVLKMLPAGENPSTISNLVSQRADVNTRDENGQTPLHVAAAGGSPWYVGNLVSEGAAINARDNSGQTPLHIAAANENPAIATKLIIPGADVNAKDKDGLTPLHITARNKKSSLIASNLAFSNADVNARDKNGQTPLHIAAANENTKIAKDLVSGGAYVNARDKDGRTPLDVALDNEGAFTVKYLLSKRALAHIEGQEKIQELGKKANKGPKKNNASTPLDVAAITVKNLPKKLSKLLKKRKIFGSNKQVSLAKSGETEKAKSSGI